jgi:ferredoxin
MSLAHLKRIRLVVSLAFLFILSALFLDLGNLIPGWFTAGVMSFQVVPALVKTVTGKGLWTVGLVTILVMTVVIGRAYCSSLCPLGTFQDLFIRLAKKRNRKRWFKYKRPSYALHYSVGILTLLLALAGSMTLINVLEPFSNFGRIIQGLVRPVEVAANNGAAWILGRFDTYWLHTVPLLDISVDAVAVPLFFALFLGWLSYNHGRLFCNLLCPAGALLSLVSRFSLLKIVIDEKACRDCGLCEMVCKAKCIDAEHRVVDYGACVNCFNCIESCPTVGLKYESVFGRGRAVPAVAVDRQRRSILMWAAMPAVSLLKGPNDSSATVALQPRQLHPVTPPGSIGLDHFSQLCTACHLCISVCPTRVLVPSLFDYGLGGVFQPKMDYWVSYCNYDCTLCGSVCPSGAILPLPPEEKKLVQMGKAKFVKDDCIVITKKTDCGACSEHCPTKAVHMVPYEKLMLPETKEEVCIGCGACERTCPTKPRKAIYVEANVVHQRAEKPQVKKLEQEPLNTTDFPF